MRMLLIILLLPANILFGMIEFGQYTRLGDATLIDALRHHLSSEYREKTADDFDRALSRESLGTILNRAADLITTRITLVATRQSSGVNLSGNSPGEVIVHARYLVENTSEEPFANERYLRFTRSETMPWQFAGDATRGDFYLNLMKIY